MSNGCICYLSVPLGYQLWDKVQTKLEVAAGMVRQAMDIIGTQRQVFLLCDSRFQKDALRALWMNTTTLTSFVMPGLILSCMVCHRKISAKTGGWKVGVRPVLTRLWGGRVVYAIVTLPKSGNGSRRLFFCTNAPEEITLDYRNCADDAMREYGKEDIRYLPLACYMLRWNIEVSYYENKAFWPLEEYHVRSREGIERLINLECIAYSSMALLPYSDEFFHATSLQVRRRPVLVSGNKFKPV